MKRFISFLLASMLLFLFTSCDNTADTDENVTDAVTDADTTSASAAVTETEPAETVITEEEKMWSVGFAKEGIIPDDYNTATDSYGSEYYVAGYKNDNPATGMLDPQCARAVYMSDKNGNNIVIAAVDCVGMSREDIAFIRERISVTESEYALTAVHVLSTHTHAGIDTLGLWGPVAQDGKSDSFMEKVYVMTAKAITEACKNSRDGSLYYGKADTGDLQRDSRQPYIYDTNVHCFRFAPADGSNGLRIISYAAHAESLRSENTKVSADYPHYMGEKLKAETGDDYIFLAGAVGGLIMTERQKNSSGAEYPVETNVVKTGERLADYVLSIKDEAKLPPSLSDKNKTFAVELDNKLYIALSGLGVLSAKPVDGGGQYGLALETSAGILRIGTVNIALVPGELFPELAYGGSLGDKAANGSAENPEPLTSVIGDENLLVWGLCDDELGYIVTPDDFLLDAENPYLSEAVDKNGRDHYEETNSVGIEMAYKLAEVFAELAK